MSVDNKIIIYTYTKLKNKFEC